MQKCILKWLASESVSTSECIHTFQLPYSGPTWFVGLPATEQCCFVRGVYKQWNGLLDWNGLPDWHIFGFYTFLVGLIDSHWLQVPSGDL